MAESGGSGPNDSDQDQPSGYEDTTGGSVMLSQTDNGQSEDTAHPVRRRITYVENIGPREINREEIQQPLAECSLASIPDGVHFENLNIVNFIGNLNISQGTTVSGDGELPDMVNERLKSAKDIFVKTDAYLNVCDALAHHGHVLITGSPGSGKTTMALYIMGTYRKQKYKVKFVDEVTSFKVEEYVNLSEPTLLVLDDVFGRFSPTSEIRVRCTNIFNYLETHFKRLDEKRTKRQIGDKYKSDDISGNLKIIMCSRTNISKHPIVSTMLQKYRTSLFRFSTIADLTITELKDREKENILRKHVRKGCISVTSVDVEHIAHLKYRTLGFPYICQLFVDNWSSQE
ncbi:uncharacterized protein LOC124137098 isoform X2 [Haliotis rufescens]|uniref:uncharacterized protein LOC124137098 isoform X2 n=1 Tax=Haliotis rufescens TaxID=6454 RepID=UPI00201FA9F9|nr:uncharacterized protein LOC124137098 isoform X2 [Haliotis rufescens]